MKEGINMIEKNRDYPYFPPTNQVVINQRIAPVLPRPCHPGSPVRCQPITKVQHKIPTSGPLTGNGFRLISGKPYLIDTTQTMFGAKINVGDNVYTRITKRSDIACIDLSARIDMTTSMHTATALAKYLNDTIALAFNTLEGYLPMLKSELIFKLYYNILDRDRGIVTSGSMSCTTENVKFHETDINDYYLTSAYSTMIADIPAMEYGGIYLLELTKFEVSVPMFDTKSHLDAGLNPYYAFSDDYSSIVIDHNAVSSVIPPDQILALVETEFTEGNLFEFQSSVSTRFKFTFEAYLSDMIWETNTYETYQALYNPAQQRIDVLEQAVADLTTDLENTKNLLNETITNYEAKFQTIDSRLDALENRVTTLETNDAAQDTLLTSHTASLEDLDTRVSRLENIKYAVVWYKEGKTIYPSQLVWENYGELYQATTEFVASGVLADDVSNGNLIALVYNPETETVEPQEGTSTSDGDVVGGNDNESTDLPTDDPGDNTTPTDSENNDNADPNAG